MALLVLTMLWLVMIFVSFRLFAPRNATVLTALFLSSVSIGSESG